MQRRPYALLALSLVLQLGLFATAPVAYSQGIFLSGVGPVNRSMGGASTAAPIDAMGALHWNPASISGMEGSELSFGVEMLLASEELGSAITSPSAISGSDRAEAGVSIIPSIGWVNREEGSPWTIGLGVYGLGGFRTNYPASTLGGTHNPILLAQPLGLGGLFSEAEFMQIAPTAAYAVTDQLSFGIAPTLTMGRVALDPLLTTDPDPATLVYPTGTHNRWSFGGGIQLGVFYIHSPDLRFGMSLKSPQWMEDFRTTANYPSGASTKVRYELDLPMILSLGASYTGIEDYLFSFDVRYFDYSQAAGFGDSASFSPSGALIGLGWRSIFSFALGMERHVSEDCRVRVGYTFQQNPITSATAAANVGSPLIVEHLIATGLSYSLNRSVDVSLAYIHGFENSISGPLATGGTVTSTISADALNFGVTVKY